LASFRKFGAFISSIESCIYVKFSFYQSQSLWYGSIITDTKKKINQKMNAFKTNCKSALELHHINSWENSRQLQCGGKLQTCITFKQNFGLEKYLLLKQHNL
jgi:hypothetical protein